MPKEKNEKLELTPDEKLAIENRRKANENLEHFKQGYQKLVDETGLGWVVDGNSQLNNIQLGIAQVNK